MEITLAARFHDRNEIVCQPLGAHVIGRELANGNRTGCLGRCRAPNLLHPVWLRALDTPAQTRGTKLQG